MGRFIQFLTASAALIFLGACGGGGSGSADSSDYGYTAFEHNISADMLAGKHLVGYNDKGSTHFRFDTNGTVIVEKTDTNGTDSLIEGTWNLLSDNVSMLLQVPEHPITVTFDQIPADRNMTCHGHYAAEGEMGSVLMLWDDTESKWWYELDPYDDKDVAKLNDKRFILALPGENVLLDLDSSGEFLLSTKDGNITGMWEIFSKYTGLLQLTQDPNNGKLRLNYQQELEGQIISVDLLVGFRRAPTEADVPLIIEVAETDLFYAGHLMYITDPNPAP